MIWDGWIGPENLIGLVWNTAPYLQARLPAAESKPLPELAAGPEGFLRILASWRNLLDETRSRDEQLLDYFTLCLACHHATVATFVPTDVDTKIRGLLWRETRDPLVLRAMLTVALAGHGWTLAGISQRVVRGVSGHDGEHWSVWTGALGRMLEAGDAEGAACAMAAIESEIGRESRVFLDTLNTRDAETDLLLLAMSIAHNRGDLNQGISFWKNNEKTQPARRHLESQSQFPLVLKLYQDTGLSAEGHRHYPLRGVKPLRRSPETLLPLAPFLDDWGAAVSRIEERGEVLEALIEGCRKIPGQQGYYRAIAGMREASGSRFAQAVEAMPNAARRELRAAEMQKLIAVPRASFTSMMKKRARAIVSSRGTAAP